MSKLDSLLTGIPVDQARQIRECFEAVQVDNAALRRQVEAGKQEEEAVRKIAVSCGNASYQQQLRAESAEAENAELRTMFRVNILRLRPETTHEEIDAAIDAARKESK